MVERGSKGYSIAEARNRLAQLVHEAEDGSAVELTRRGEPVAVIVSAQEFQRWRIARPQFWKRLRDFQRRLHGQKIDIRPEDFEGIRDREAGRKVELRD